MDQAAVQRWLRDRVGIHVGPRTAEYAARQLAAQLGAFYVIGGDARTGRPVRLKVPAELLADVNNLIAEPLTSDL